MASNKYLVVTVIIYTQYFLVIPNYNPIRSVLSPSAGDFDEDPGERAAKVFEDRRAQTRQAQSAGPDDLLIFLVDFSMKETIYSWEKSPLERPPYCDITSMYIL